MFWLGETIGHDVVVIDVSEAGFRLEISVLDGLRRIGLFDHQIGLGEAPLHIADPDRDVLGHVIGRVVVQHRRARLHGFVRIEHRGQRLVVDLDGSKRALGGEQVLRGDRRHRLAHVTHLAARHDRLVVDEDAETVLARYVGAR